MEGWEARSEAGHLRLEGQTAQGQLELGGIYRYFRLREQLNSALVWPSPWVSQEAVSSLPFVTDGCSGGCL